MSGDWTICDHSLLFWKYFCSASTNSRCRVFASKIQTVIFHFMVQHLSTLNGYAFTISQPLLQLKRPIRSHMTSCSANGWPLRLCVRVKAWECVRSSLHYIWRTARIPRITLCLHTRLGCVIVNIRHVRVRWAFTITIARNFVYSHSLTPFVDTIYTPSDSHRISPEKTEFDYFFRSIQ